MSTLVGVELVFAVTAGAAATRAAIMKRPAAGSLRMASSLLPAGADDSSLLRYSRARKQPSGRQLLRKPDLRYWVATPGSWRRQSGQRAIPAGSDSRCKLQRHDMPRPARGVALLRARGAYLPPPGGADLQDYVITVELDGRRLQTMTRDGAER